MKRSNFKLFGLLVALFACVTLLASCSVLNPKLTMHIQGSEVQVVEATYGDKYELPELANRDLYIFEGWYDNAEFAGDAIEFVIVGENTHVWAKWHLLTNVTGIKVVSNPTKVAYKAFEKFDSEGLVVVATCADGNEYQISNHLLSFNKSTLVVKDEKVVLSWEEYSAEIDVTVEKADFDLSNVRFADKKVVYNGEEQTLSYTGVLPQGLTAKVEGAGVNASETPYEIKLVFSVEDEENYNVPESLTAGLTIEQATFDVSGISFVDASTTYNGKVQSIGYTGELPEGVEAVLSNHEHEEAGSYTATLSFVHENPNYKSIPSKTAKLTINKADYDMSGVKWNYSQPLTYNTKEQSVEIDATTLPEGVTVKEYVGAAGTDAKAYEANATFNYDSKNYNEPKLVEALVWAINPTVPTFDIKGLSAVYGTELGDIELPELEYGYLAWDEANEGEILSVGEWKRTVTFTSTSSNYLDTTTTAEFEITRATYNMNNVKWDYIMPFANDGTVKTVAIASGLPAGVTVKSYVNASASATGKYSASAEFNYDENNYNEPVVKALTWEIKDIISIPDAIALGFKQAHNTYTSEKYFVEGVVSSIASTTYGNLYIQDANGNQLYIYGLYTTTNGTTDGTRYDKMTDKPVVGDKILVYTVLGTYSGAQQGKNAWLIKQTEATGLEKASIAASSVVIPSVFAEDTTLPSTGILGSTITWSAPKDSAITIENGVAIIKQSGENQEVVLTAYIKVGEDTFEKEFTVTVPFKTKVGATFELGANGSASHNDGSSATTYTETDGIYKLSITNGNKLYKGARDNKGNSALKLGTSSAVGSFKFTVSEDVKMVVIYVAKYKTNTTKINVNGVAYTLTKNSNNGEYDEITVDTSVNKTVTLTTVSGGVRAMVNTIEFLVPDVPSEGPTDEEIVASDTDALTVANVLEGNITLPVAGQNGSKISWTSSNSSVASVNNTSGLLTVTRSATNTTAKLTATLTYGEETGTKSFDVVVIAKAGEISIEDANAIGKLKEHDTYTGDKFTIIGEITQVYNAQYGNMYVKDTEGNTITIYGTYSADGSARYDAMATKPVAGDTVKLYGVLGQYNGTAQMKNAWILEIIEEEVVEYEVVAVSNDNNMGTCSVNSTSIAKGEKAILTVSPKEGYEVSKIVVVTPEGSEELEVVDGKTTYEVVVEDDIEFVVTFVKTEVTLEPTDAELVALDKEALELETTDATDGIILPKNGENGSIITWTSSNSSVITIENGEALITRPAAESGDAIVTLTATIAKGNSSDTKEFEVEVKAEEPASKKYVKVTSAPSDWSGTYLIVYEKGKLAFNGGLTTLDAEGNLISVTIVDGTIESTDATNAASFTIAKSGTNYTIKSASGYYIGQTSNANGLKSNKSTQYANTITFNNGNVDIVSGSAYLRYNANTNNGTRFRYYKSSSYTNQQAIQLYKLV